jgi:hypothetical protein
MKNNYLILIFCIYLYNDCFCQAPVFILGSMASGCYDDILYDTAIPDSTLLTCTIGCPLTLVGKTKSDDGNLTNCNSLSAGNNQALVLLVSTFGTLGDSPSYGGGLMPNTALTIKNRMNQSFSYCDNYMPRENIKSLI